MSDPPKQDGVVNYQFRANDWTIGIEEGRAIERAARKQRARGPDDPLTMAEAAAKLGCSVKTLKGHIEAGRLRYFTTGHGSKRRRKMVTAAELNEFIAAQSRKDSSPCPSTKTRARRSGSSISRSAVIAFTARPNARPSGKRKR
jgi:excisionase family DNA binding protein